MSTDERPFGASAQLYDAIYAWKDYAAEVTRLGEIIDGRMDRRAATLLDVACGTGTHLAHLADRLAVEGLDRDPAMLEVARTRLPDVTFHEDDMVDFDLGRTFDVVTCLFSSIAYVTSERDLDRAVASMARHLAPEGLLIVEPWFSSDGFHDGGVHANFVDEPTLKVARMNVSRVEGDVSVLDFDYLVGRPDGVEHFSERHELRLIDDTRYRIAFERAGLQVDRDEMGLMGRGLYVGTRTA